MIDIRPGYPSVASEGNRSTMMLESRVMVPETMAMPIRITIVPATGRLLRIQFGG